MVMAEAGNVLQRAFALANSGDFHTLDGICRQLTSEGYVLDVHFNGRSLKRQLRNMMAAASDSAPTISMEKQIL